MSGVRAALVPSVVDQHAVDMVGRRFVEHGFEDATLALRAWIVGEGAPTYALVAELRFWLDHLDRPSGG